ncbi:MAG: DUF1328 domain-containing protein [Planctomycetes bacterium]|nr:DUF1328 domain-containing protein [Planctomycetota bacterium]
MCELDGRAGAATEVARVLFFLFLVVFLVSLVLGLARKGK